MSEHTTSFVETTDSLLDEETGRKEVHAEEPAPIESQTFNSSIDQHIEEIEDGINVVVDTIQEMYDRHGCNIL